MHLNKDGHSGRTSSQGHGPSHDASSVPARVVTEGRKRRRRHRRKMELTRSLVRALRELREQQDSPQPRSGTERVTNTASVATQCEEPPQPAQLPPVVGYGTDRQYPVMALRVVNEMNHPVDLFVRATPLVSPRLHRAQPETELEDHVQQLSLAEPYSETASLTELFNETWHYRDDTP